MKTRVFCGPTIAREDVEQRLPGAAVEGPVGWGDVFRASESGVERIAIIDGYFDQRQPVWHKEILFALHAGVQVWGAGSMGALRAVELAPFGMRGVGKIYELYRDGWLERDDEVTVVHDSADAGHRVLSEALVNMRFTFRRAARERVIDDEVAERCTGIAEQLFYAERSYRAVLAVLARDELNRATAEQLSDWLRNAANRIDQKRADALELLARLASGASTAPRVNFAFATTEPWVRFVSAVRASRDS